jgi:uncharacterized protein
MNILTEEDLGSLALGSAVLGSGGGGNPAYDLLMARYVFEKHGPVKMISVQDLKDEDFIAPFDFMGAPSIAREKLPSGSEFITISRLIEETLGKKVTALVAGEIGGSNAFTPLIAASILGLPLVDGDNMGRAFPELQMCTTYLKDIPASPAFLADSVGNHVVLHALDAFEVEKIARHIAVAMGSNCALSHFFMHAEQARQAIIPGSYSKAIRMGNAMKAARLENKSPTEALLEICEGIRLGQGTLVDINQIVKDGFLQGSASIQTSNGKVEVLYQNEYLLAKQNGGILASTPDILMILDSESGTPITSDTLKYGLRVDVIALPSPAIWRTTAGLNLVGPRVFGYNIDYQPLSERNICQQII